MAATAEARAEPVESTHNNDDQVAHERGLQASAADQHEHSDSMVTIRLSEHPEFRQISASGSGQIPDKEEDEQVKHSNIASVEIAGPTEDDLPAENEEDLQEENYVTKPNPLHRASRVRFDMDEAIEEDSARDSIPVFQAEDEPIGRSQASSKSSFSQIAIEDADTLEAEMQNHASRVRSQSSGSSDSGSAQVDWAELDKNEEQERRDEATDEVDLTCSHKNTAYTDHFSEHCFPPGTTRKGE